MTYDELLTQHNRLKELVLNLRNEDGLTLRAQHNDFGPERYFCPACGANKSVTCALEFCSNLSEVNHEPDCALVALVNEIDTW